ncbi:EGLN protein, partial [Psilopogon haemacephalus]|nr:EGLN protein [Psilopogon haemacephalus]
HLTSVLGELMSLVFRPDPGRAEGCDLQPVTAEPPVTLSYATSTVPRGCVSSSSLGTGHEVHILSIKWSKVRMPSWLCFTSTPSMPGKGFLHFPHTQPMPGRDESQPPPWLRLLLAPQDAHLDQGMTTALGPVPLATSEGQLLAWARDTYRSITSYSELWDPLWIQLHLGEDASSPMDCIPQEHFDATLHLKAEVFFYGMKSCSLGDAQSTRAAHIIQMQSKPSSLITDVNLSLSCPERAVSNQILILQSQANLTWFLSVNNCHIQFLVSGNYEITRMSSVLLRGPVLPDTEQGLVAKALEMNCSAIASYSVIPASTHVSLEILDHVEMVSVVPTPPVPTANSMPSVVLLMLQPWKCTDETMEIVINRSYLQPIKDLVNITLRDISCQAEKNATHFMLRAPLSQCGTSLEDRGHANNELILNLAKGAAPQSVRVAFKCKIPRELFLRLFPTAAFEGPQTELEVNKEAFCKAGLQVCISSPKHCDATALLVPTIGSGSLVGLPNCQEVEPGREQHPWSPKRLGAPSPLPFLGAGLPPLTQHLPPQNNTIFEKVLKVMVKDSWRPPNNHGLGLAAVLGITFGAFLIGALLTAGLWYIYSHTRPISKLQPVSSTAPASESSSTNHSIGSTQSTPCSTSSMA